MGRLKQLERDTKRLNRNLKIFSEGDKKIRECKKSGKKAVLIMVDSFYRAGAQRVAATLADGLSEYYSVTLFCKKKDDPEYPAPEGVGILYLPQFIGDKEEQARYEERYVKWIKMRLRIKASISMLFWMNDMNVRCRVRDKVICCERNNPSKKEPENMSRICSIYEQADHVVFQSQKVRDLFPESVKNHSSIILNPTQTDVKRKGSTRHRIVNIGRLHPQKNQGMLIRAFNEFHISHPEYELSIYGDGSERRKLEELVHDLGLEDAVVFHGNTENVHEEAADAEMAVLSSDYEGLPNALLECMMMGMACISTACEGAVDVIDNNENGLLTGIGDEKALAEAMTRLADDPLLRKKLGDNAMKSSERFRKDRIIAQWRQLIEDLK